MRLFENALFISMNAPEESFAALLEDKGRILHLYSSADGIPSGLEAERVDLAGAHVYPGFVDTHTHAFEGGLYSLCPDLGGCRSVAEVLASLAAAEPVGGMLIGWNLDIHTLAEKRFPTLEELDRLFPELPVLIRRVDGHSSVINGVAAAAVPWQGDAPLPENPLIRGHNHAAVGWFHSSVDDEGILAAYGAASDLALAAGLTGLHAMTGDGKRDPRHYRLVAANLGSFGADFTLYPQIRDIDTALRLGSPRVGGCILADGSIGSHTAALKAPYADRPDFSGELYESDDHWYQFLRSAHAAGLSACVHAIGDAAVGQIAALLRRIYDEDPKPLRHQIIHCEMADDRTIALLAGTPAAAVMQPAFDALWGGKGGLYEERLGTRRKQLCNRLESMVKAGILVTGGSDWYITPLDPLLGIKAATSLSVRQESLSGYDAVALYTRNAAELAGKGGEEGILKKGYRCNLSVLSAEAHDPECRVVGVIKGGISM